MYMISGEYEKYDMGKVTKNEGDFEKVQIHM